MARGKGTHFPDASQFKTDVIINNMPARMPAKKSRTVLFDFPIAAALIWGGR
jgi:hypothetical protein